MAVPKWLPLFLMLMTDRVPASAGENVWTSLGPDGGPSGLVVVHPADSNVVYAVGPGGLFKSFDAGASWAALPAVPGFVGLGSLVVDPTTPDTLYAAVNNTGPPSGTVFKSSDGGASWRAILSGVSASLAMDPADPRTLYVGGYSEVFKTSNGGESWVGSSSGFSRCCLEPKALVDPHNTGTVYAHTQSGLFRSKNGGATWSSVYAYDTPDVPRMGSVVLDPRVPDTLYAVMGRIPGQPDFLPTVPLANSEATEIMGVAPDPKSR